MIRPAIEEHDQNRGAMEFENCLVFGLREALLAWCMADAGRVREYVRALLESDSQIPATDGHLCLEPAMG